LPHRVFGEVGCREDRDVFARPGDECRDRVEVLPVCRLKQWRGIATRYDKYALTFLGGVLLATSILRVRTIIQNYATRLNRVVVGSWSVRCELTGGYG
jgi:hypothetical protein